MQSRDHRLPEEISIALHQAVADRIRREPKLLEIARRRVESWGGADGVSAWYADHWRKLLAREPLEVADAIVERDELTSALRQVSPFAGLIDPRTRWRIRREVRARLTSSPRVR